MTLSKLPLIAILFIAAIAGPGCGESPEKPQADGSASSPITKVAGQHEGWWCDEHGVPEGICAQCDAKVAAELKNKGDWCRQHDRPDSQCFVCHPELSQDFAALYEAKFGKAPPPRSDEQVN